MLEQNLGDVELCLALCALLEVDAHPDDVAAMFNPPPEAGVALKQPVSESQTLIAGRYEMSADGTEKETVKAVGRALNPLRWFA